MNTRSNGLQELLEQLEEAKPKAPPETRYVSVVKLEDMPPFEFSKALDKEGLRQESPDYVKRNCKDCYGRGYVIQSLYGRRYQVCACVNRGYVKLRLAHDKSKL